MCLVQSTRSDLMKSMKLKPGWSCVEMYNRLIAAKLALKGAHDGTQAPCALSLEGLLAFARRFFAPHNLARVQLYLHGNCSPENALGFAAAVDERLLRRVLDTTDAHAGLPSAHTDANIIPRVRICRIVLLDILRGPVFLKLFLRVLHCVM